MTTTPAAALTAFLALLSTSPDPALPERWQQWLGHDVAVIISAEEKRMFLDLTTDEARERFVDKFWQVRDPIPGTKVNEFKEEHMRRLAYADEQFGRDGTRPGSRSARGRMYILFGEPQDRRFFHSSAYGLYPAELWFYQTPKDMAAGLPSFFYLLFFKPRGVGDYKLYSPVGDGPDALVGGFATSLNRNSALSALKEIDPEIYRASISLDPGSGADYDTGSIDLSSELLLAKIANLPNTLAETRYLPRYSQTEKGEVKTTITYSQFQLDPLVLAEADADGVTGIDYEVLVPPDDLGLDVQGGNLTAGFELYVVVRDGQGRTITQRTEPVTINLARELEAQALSAPFAIQGRVGLVPGSYEVSFLLRNRQTGQFGVGNEKVVVPEVGENAPAATELFGFLLGFHAEPLGDASASASPFAAGSFRVFPARGGQIGLDETPWVSARLRYPRGPDGPPKLIKTVTLLRKGQEVWGYMGFLSPNPAFDGGVLTIAEELRLGDAAGASASASAAGSAPGGEKATIAPGEYELLLRIQGREGNTLAERRQPLLLVEKGPARAWSLARESRRAGMRQELARQYLVRGERPRAARELELAADEEKAASNRLQIAALLLDMGEAERASKIAIPIAAFPDAPPLAHVYAAASLAMRDRPAEAAVEYEKALSTQGDKPEVALLNALCECYGRSGKKKEARDCFGRSLLLSPEQPAVKKALAGLGG